ncbi:type II toxin-antitoxin system RelE/ParE family toxin [Asticcacaulis benevestitus]|uniref:type II toxin-antitoxin system RelE/ParE family toxin n=1 Tax=Asticcacaulis benevestitus TaxID=347481 RepID=UPI0009D9FFDE|nr:type II toxin-antitoxin system RelE/ParE family toxin [Asticcacaulis benevestitus]
MQIFIMPAARHEIDSAFDWYEQQRTGLGLRFSQDIYGQLNKVAANPSRFPFVTGDVRRVRLLDFPYGLFFRAHNNGLYVLAYPHSHRNPMVWKNRIYPLPLPAYWASG